MHENDLAGVDQRDIVDLVILLAILLLAGTSLLSIAAQWPWQISATNVGLLGVLSLYIAYRRMIIRPDHVRAQQSDRILTIARETLTYFREGLSPETAAMVCEIILRNSNAAISVAITDDKKVIGFAGVGSDHHRVGKPIVTRATRHTLIHDTAQILSHKSDIGCPDMTCPIIAAIIVPLHSRDVPIGTLKFYYDDERHLNETELAMAEGLAGLLSTQLELHELGEQASLATEMELKALQAQINPHFLFNTLNTISSFIRTNPDLARELLKRFAKFYRYSLEHETEEVKLGHELDFVEQYFALEQARFGDRLSLEIKVDDDIRELPMPPFMLQPLVENSVAHGIRPDGTPLSITVESFLKDDQVRLCVSDDGVGMSPEKLETIFEHHSGKGLGIALRNVRDRLSNVYGPESRFVIESEEGIGTKTWFHIPYVEADEDKSGNFGLGN